MRFIVAIGLSARSHESSRWDVTQYVIYYIHNETGCEVSSDYCEMPAVAHKASVCQQLSTILGLVYSTDIMDIHRVTWSKGGVVIEKVEAFVPEKIVGFIRENLA